MASSWVHTQTWPSNPALFKNSFNYYTVSTTPVDFQECNGFIGRQGLIIGMLWHAALRVRCPGRALHAGTAHESDAGFRRIVFDPCICALRCA
jgi:hypothetical protein